mmetsp:Transcript_10932/g.30914  ORF Transcript_10932/g.30914 Transcript_10932/m.30914 type:complete len:133 (-) Transcript_10932:111-509(-)
MGDIVTQIQDQLNLLCSTMFNLTGTLQRDAPPLSLDGEPAAPSPVPGFNTKEATEAMAAQISEASKLVDTLVRSLPDTETSEEQLRRIAALQEENELVGQELDSELEKADRQLAELQDMFALLADRKLLQRR